MREAPPNFNPSGWDADAPKPRYSMGKRIRVRLDAQFPAHSGLSMLQGRSGVIERVCGHAFSTDAAASEDVKRPLYRVRFALVDIWPEGPGDGYGPLDTLDVELLEQSLEPFFDYGADFSAEAERVGALIEAGAIARPPHANERDAAIFSNAATPVPSLEIGARLIARAWVDEGFKARLLLDGPTACAQLRLPLDSQALYAFENTDDVHNLILDSGGVDIGWAPRRRLGECGIALSDATRLQLHLGGASNDLRISYLTLPQPPTGVEEWTEAQLAALVSNAALIGADTALTPTRER